MGEEVLPGSQDQTNKAIPLDSVDDINTFLDTDNDLVSKEELVQMDAIIEKRQHDLIVNQDTFDIWYDKITRRRMFALARLRKLTIDHKKRIKFYDEVKKQLEKKKENVNGQEQESFTDTSVSTGLQSTNLDMDGHLSKTQNSSRLSSVDTEFKPGTATPKAVETTIQSNTEYDGIDSRMISASDTTIQSGFAESEVSDAKAVFSERDDR